MVKHDNVLGEMSKFPTVECQKPVDYYKLPICETCAALHNTPFASFTGGIMLLCHV